MTPADIHPDPLDALHAECEAARLADIVREIARAKRLQLRAAYLCPDAVAQVGDLIGDMDSEASALREWRVDM